MWGDGKPPNILVFDAPGDIFGYTLKLTDFGSTTSPEVFWDERSFPVGSPMWTSAYSIYWSYHCSVMDDDPSDLEAQAEHFKQCFHFDTFVAGLLVLFLLIGEDEYQNSEVSQSLKSKSPEHFSSMENFKSLDLPKRAKSTLDTHFTNLSMKN